MPQEKIRTPASTTIVHIPEVCGGSAVFEGTRMMIWLIIGELQNGMTEERFLHNFPSMTRAHLQAARDYFDKNREEILSELAANNE